MALRTNWRGVFPAIVTPFSKDGAFIESDFRALIELLIKEGVTGIVATGSTGEWYTLSDQERVKVWEVAVEAAKGRISVIAGTSAAGTREAVSLTKTAKSVGVDGCMLLPPGGTLASRKEVVAHFHAVAKVGIPLMIYNNPPRTGVSIDPDMAAEIAQADEIVCFKDSNRDLYAAAEIIYRIGDRVAFFAGLEPYTSALVPRGATGVVSLISNICAADMVEYFNQTAAQDLPKVFKPQKKIDELYHFLPTLGVPGIVATKAAMAILDRPGGEVRQPHLPADAAVKTRLEQGLKKLGFL